jgi:hypothetical protein
MPGRIINIHDAKVKTMSVGIKAMTINDRQVTLAVFRQLLDVDLISDDGTLNGIPWGIINYHPDKCADHSPHLHIVWQDGEELRRATVMDPQHFDSHTSQAADDYLTLRTIQSVFFGAEPPPISSYNDVWQFHLKSHKDISVTAFESEETKELRNASRQVYHPYAEGGVYYPNASFDALNELFNKVRFLRAKLEKSFPILQQEIAAESKRRNKLRETLQGLRQLPQLFIAV